MSSTRTTRSLFALTILLGCSALPGAEPNETTTPLTIESSSVEVPWPAPSIPRLEMSAAQWENLRPTYAAGITFRGAQNVAAPGYPVWTQFVNERRGGRDVSPKQQKFLSTLNPAYLASSYDGRWTVAGRQDDPNYRSVLFYAVSPEDARKMAEAYLRTAQNAYDSDRKRLVNHVEQVKNHIAFAEKRIPELEESLKTSRAALEDLRRTIPYHTDQEATAAIGELDRMINTARVEIAGIKAKLDAIHSYGSNQPTAVAAKLEAMLVEESIALRAAEARKTEATFLRTQAAKFVELNKTLEKAPREKDSLTRELAQRPQELQNNLRELAKLQEREAVPLDHKVFIYPVKLGRSAPMPGQPDRWIITNGGEP
jgi:hypothetical protein